MTILAPRRQRGIEIMDEPSADPELVVRSLADVAVANRFFGGSRAVVRELLHFIDATRNSSAISLLDVGTGLGDIPVAASRAALNRGVRIEAVGIDASEASLRARRDPATAAVRGNALQLPFANGSFDVVTCSQVLHHFEDPDLCKLVQELDRVARRCVIVSDIRRSWLAAAGLWLASFPLRFHPISRHDGVVSVMRGFTTAELRSIVQSAAGLRPRVESRLGFRVTASWIPQPQSKGLLA
jgi:2-polyprenyl-3-methyl-5-hydroxy-6-metoxy-1,4-benzoquinol methylase